MPKKKNWLDKKIEKMRKRAEKDKRYRNVWLVIWVLLLTAWTGCVFYLAQVAVFAVMQFGIEKWGWSMNLNVAQTICVSASYILALAVMLLVPKKLVKLAITRDGLGLKGMPTWTDIGLAPIGYVASLALGIGAMMVLQVIAPTIDWMQAQDVGYNSVYTNFDKIITFVALVVLAPIAEELIFRGFLYGKLRMRLSAVPAIVIVSALFGFMHGQWNVGIIVGIMSVFMCIARELTGTVYAGIIMHMIRNCLAFFLLYIVNLSVALSGTSVAMLTSALFLL